MTDPVSLYLARLGPNSKRVQAQALRDVGSILWPGTHPSHRPWHEVTYADAIDLRARLLGQGSPATAKRKLAAFRCVMKECWRAGLIDAERLARVTDLAPITWSYEPAGRALQRHQYELMLAAALGQRDRALIAVLASTGFRRAEVAGLRRRDVMCPAPDVADLTVRGKGNKERTVRINNGAFRELSTWLRAAGLRSDDLVFQTDSPGLIRARVVRMAKDAGIGHVTTHDLRRSFATWMDQQGASLHLIQQTMGHASPLTTARYIRQDKDAQAKAAKKLGI